MNKQYRFFYHYYKAKNKMSVHFRGVCHVVNNVECKVACQTKWSKKQPNLTMIGYAKNVEINNGVASIF